MAKPIIPTTSFNINTAFVDRARALTPVLYEAPFGPVRDSQPYPPLGKGDRLRLDFGDHYVGFVTLRLSSVGYPQDAPAFFKLKFGEILSELDEDADAYDGWISRGWIQEAYLHVDTLPVTLRLPRRYAFRYMELYVIDTSPRFHLVVDDVQGVAVTAADDRALSPPPTTDETLLALDAVSVRTLRNCMQSVFEDGPKRDRRLWIGDLRLQALVNYETFKHYDLVKRCLYLFAGLTRDDGCVAACVFVEPNDVPDDIFMFDYALFFVSVLHDYYIATKDAVTLRDLWPCAHRQIQLAQTMFDERHLIEGRWARNAFVDWKSGLDKQAAAQGIYIYCARQAARLAAWMGDEASAADMTRQASLKAQAAWTYLWDASAGLFVSGPDRQISYASQVWMILAAVVDAQTGAAMLDALKKDDGKPALDMVTPYMNHHYVEALFLCGKAAEGLAFIRFYWGGMLAKGADTFWEIYNPDNPDESPYGSAMVNSYCHAWSCTPAYFLRKFRPDR